MSILKSILHRYNTTNQNYDTLHPETEHAQVTDFGQGVIAHLASSTLVSLVTSVSTGSVFGKMVEKLLEASGVQYNFTNANAWYICLGSLFGGLIIQGGLVNVNLSNNIGQQSESLPITWDNFLQGVACYDYPTGTPRNLSVSIDCNATTVTIGVWCDSYSGMNMRYVVFGAA